MATFGTMHRRRAPVDIFTDAYRVSGRFDAGSRGLFAELDNPNSDFFDVFDAYVSRINSPGEIITNYTETSFRKDNVNFVVLRDRLDGVASINAHSRSIFARGKRRPLFLTIPGFEISGHTMCEGDVTAGTLLTHSIGNYLMIFEAVASASLFPLVAYKGDLILIRKDRIGILAFDESKNG